MRIPADLRRPRRHPLIRRNNRETVLIERYSQRKNGLIVG